MSKSSQNYNRRDFIKLAGTGVLAGLLPFCSSSKKRPNIVFIMADDMGYGDVECYNPDSKIPTPNMDELAKEGVRFTDVHTPAAICTPTRYGLLTGRYCWRTRLKKGVLIGYDETPLIEPGRMTIANLLKNKGYETACVGKWHLGLNWPTKEGSKLQDDENKWGEYSGVFKQNEENIDFAKPIDGGPTDLGFDYFYGTAGCSTSDSPYCFIENKHTISIPTKISTEEYNKLPGFLPGLMADDWSEEDVDPIFTEKAIQFIKNHQQKKSNNPFFLYLALSSPHIPWLVPDFIKGKSQEGPRGDLIALVDWCAGQVLAALDKLGIRENTLVFVTSDNGPRKGSNGHKSAGDFRGFKGDIWEGGHRVPFIVRWPGRIKPGTRCDEVISLTDMFATFAAMTGTELSNNAGEDSFNFLPALWGKQKNKSNREATVFHSGGGAFAIRQDNWKLILGTKQAGRRLPQNYNDLFKTTGQLYDMQNDPYEKNDLWEKHPDIVTRLTELFEQYRKQGYSRPMVN